MSRKILTGPPTMPPCVLLAALAIVWFVWISAFGAFHTQGKTGPAFKTMLDLAPPNLWLAALVVLTVGHGFGIVHRRYRRWANLSATVFWLFIAATFFASNPHGIGAPTYLLVAIGAAWAYLRA